MTIQERINCGSISEQYKTGWREGTVKEFEHDFPILNGYISRINWHGRNSRVAILKSLDRDRYYHLYLFTEKHKYSIHVSPDYISGGSSCRFEEPLEDWTRGHDLPDGDCTVGTFKSILYAILADELVPYDNGRSIPIADEEEENPVES